MAEDFDYLGELDPDDSAGASQQIARQLRAAILTLRLGPGDQLPSQPVLAARYGVARETVKRALDILRSDRLIVSRQGSGVFVRAQTQRPAELRRYLEAGFEHDRVTVDFAAVPGETLRDALAEVLDRVRGGQLAPKTITIRIMLSDTSVPMVLPTGVDTQADDPSARERADRIRRRTVDSITDQVHELHDLGLVQAAHVGVRLHPAAPQFTLSIINSQDVFFGFYPVAEGTTPQTGEPTAAYDPFSDDNPMFHYSVNDDDAHGTQFVAASKQWFDAAWNSIARDYER